MNWKHATCLVAVAAFAWLAPARVEAQPSPPATFSGSASIDGKPVPDGTEVRAFIGSRDCTQPGAPGTAQRNATAFYRIEVLAESQAPGCGREGSPVTFTVGGQPASQVGSWRAAPQTLDLTASTATSTATATPPRGTTPTPASANATATSPATQTGASPPPLIRVGSGTPETAVLNGDSPPAGAPGTGLSPRIVAGLGIVIAGGLAVAGASWWWRRQRAGQQGKRSD